MHEHTVPSTDELDAQHHHRAVEAYKQADNAAWTRMWDECADLARQIAERHQQAGDSEAAAQWTRIAALDVGRADYFRGRPTEAP